MQTNHGSVTHIVGEVDPYAAVRGTSPGVLIRVDVVAGEAHRHRVPAEGYTWSDQEPIGKGRESSDRIDRDN